MMEENLLRSALKKSKIKYTSYYILPTDIIVRCVNPSDSSIIKFIELVEPYGYTDFELNNWQSGTKLLKTVYCLIFSRV
jgi:hypothetical protein